MNMTTCLETEWVVESDTPEVMRVEPMANWWQEEEGLQLTVDLVHFGDGYASLAADLLEEKLGGDWRGGAFEWFR